MPPSAKSLTNVLALLPGNPGVGSRSSGSRAASGRSGLGSSSDKLPKLQARHTVVDGVSATTTTTAADFITNQLPPPSTWWTAPLLEGLGREQLDHLCAAAAAAAATGPLTVTMGTDCTGADAPKYALSAILKHLDSNLCGKVRPRVQFQHCLVPRTTTDMMLIYSAQQGSLKVDNAMGSEAPGVEGHGIRRFLKANLLPPSRMFEDLLKRKAGGLVGLFVFVQQSVNQCSQLNSEAHHKFTSVVVV